MANPEHLDILKQGVETWNEWRAQHPDIEPDLSRARLNHERLFDANLRNANLGFTQLEHAFLGRADLLEADVSYSYLSGAYFSGADLRGALLSGSLASDADFTGARLEGASLTNARLRHAKLGGAKLAGADLNEADLSYADLTGADLVGANLSYANLSHAVMAGADLTGASLYAATLVETNLKDATLNRCFIYGISAWRVITDGTRQKDLVITDPDEFTVTVDSLEVAQFIHLLLNNQKIRHAIDVITSKVILILGRFTPQRKGVLDALREELRKYDYLPVLFDFEKPSSQDFIETVSTLAHMAKFVIADVTDAKVVLEEVPHIVRNIAVPVQPLMAESAGDEPVTLYNLRRNHRSLLDTYRYKNLEGLLGSLSEKVIAPAEARGRELRAD
jgi:uncharacterized protein YjbI with pentapeptide repeats